MDLGGHGEGVVVTKENIDPPNLCQNTESGKRAKRDGPCVCRENFLFPGSWNGGP